MKISLKWIKEFIPNLRFQSLNELTGRMIEIGLDIESIIDESKVYENFVVGEVLEKVKHPNADKLSLCKVNVGNKVLNIVCGAPNVEVGQKVCVALEGAVIPEGNFLIKKSKLRGEVSEGMICSSRELNLSDEHSGIMVLNEEAKIGQKFSELIGANDYLMEIGVTPNRGDLFSQIGMAREIGAIYDQKILIPKISVKEVKEKSEDFIKINIERNDLCKRFTARVIRNVKIQESPEWIKKKLIAVGLRPRNNIVDITNLVMMETGQPLHAFDYDKLGGKTIIVKTAKDGDKFTTLDSKERSLNSETLMICGEKNYLSIAGIMGGENSEISNDTKNILIESAYFDSVNIRKSSKFLGLQTDASKRFERGVDIDMVEYASLRATQLIQEFADGEVLNGIVDIYPSKFKTSEVGVRSSKVQDILGIELNEDEIKKLLAKIEINFLKEEQGKLIFSIPQFRRNDIEREVDLIEEVARIYGYSKIDGDSSFRVKISDDINEDLYNSINKIKDYLIGRGFNEILTLSEQNENIISKLFSDKNYIIELENPNTIDTNAMRVNLEYGMLEVIRNNINNSGKGISLKLFEIGKVFKKVGNEFVEFQSLALCLSGKKDLLAFDEKVKNFDLFDLKGEVEMLFSKFSITNYEFIYKPSDSRLDILINGHNIGSIKKVKKEILHNFDIEEENVYIAQLNSISLFAFEEFFKKSGDSLKYEEISKFPIVKRDLAFVVDKSVNYGDIEKTVFMSGIKLLKSINLFDIYEDMKLGVNKKSIALALEFVSSDKTLTDEEVNGYVNIILEKLKKTLNVEIRS